jgi:UDP-N-acetylmuramate dehydrogenase
MTAQQTALRDLTTIGVGGVPERLVVAHTRDELVAGALEIWREADEWLILGGGSNLVVADEIPHIQVLQVATKGVESTLVPGTNRVSLRVEAGENWDDLVSGTVQAGLAGLEALSGIPGSVGASPVQNIGAYGTEVANTITRIGFLDFLTGETVIIEAADLGFGYRDSVLKQGKLGVVLWVEFELENLGGLSQPIAFDQLAKALAVEIGAQVPVAEVREAVLKLRASKGMVLDATDPDTSSCGSFFTNPIVSDRHARTLPASAPRWESPDDDGLTVKLSAAWLIENAGIPKGFRIAGSNAAVSSKHTLAITNRGGATAGQILELAEFIQARVSNTFGVNLQPEPNIVGF